MSWCRVRVPGCDGMSTPSVANAPRVRVKPAKVDDCLLKAVHVDVQGLEQNLVGRFPLRDDVRYDVDDLKKVEEEVTEFVRAWERAARTFDLTPDAGFALTVVRAPTRAPSRREAPQASPERAARRHRAAATTENMVDEPLALPVTVREKAVERVRQNWPVLTLRMLTRALEAFPHYGADRAGDRVDMTVAFQPLQEKKVLSPEEFMASLCVLEFLSKVDIVREGRAWFVLRTMPNVTPDDVEFLAVRAAPPRQG